MRLLRLCPSLALVTLFGTLACGSSGSGEKRPVLEPGQAPIEGLTPGDDAARARFTQLAAGVQRIEGLDASGLASEYPIRHAAALGYSPGQAELLDRIQASSLSLDGAELDVLEKNGFVVSSRLQFPTFLRGYAAIYMADLPVFVSADALLDALHRSYDAILMDIESQVLIPNLEQLLSSMLARVDIVHAPEQTKTDLSMYLEIALALLDPTGHPATSAGAKSFVRKAVAAAGIEDVTLFGIARSEDFSQFQPRGHYLEPPLSEYFRAMIWLGRVDFRLLETLPDGSVTFRREQYDAMLAMHQLLDAPRTELWNSIDGVVRAFVGESDSMTVPEVSSLVADLGGLSAALAASDASVAQAINAGGYGEQQIASYLMVNDGVVKTLPLNRSFLLFGQRYVADSHVFSRVVFDRVAGRMMPNPLDAAFAALGNNQALALEQRELEAYPELPGALGSMRYLIDNHDSDFWGANLYNLWSASLRALSPPPDSSAPESRGLPAVAGTDAWGRRLLNTQLGSWAQLRHDTLLYAKQSYTGINSCEFPDAYVEPNPEFFHSLVRFAERGSELIGLLPQAAYLREPVNAYFDNLASAASMLADMADQERTGTPFSAAQLAFINDAVRVDAVPQGCTTVDTPNGWYARLFYVPAKSIEQDLTIADVHTQPADENGNIVGKVLHVATGFPRLMTVTANTCAGPRAYAGVAYSYHELITDDFERLNDEQWTERASSGNPAEVPWAESFIAE
jgi:uncharacterized protein DUF3160